MEIKRFETVRPDAIVEGRATDLMVEFDGRLTGARAAGKLERYDHFLAGWSAHTLRYGRRMEAAVFNERLRARFCIAAYPPARSPRPP